MSECLSDLLLVFYLFEYLIPIIYIFGSPPSTHSPTPLSFPSPLAVQEEAKSLSESRAELEKQLATSTSTVAILQTENAKLQTELQESKKEQDDLLMLLADQDQKILSLKQKLKDLGETVRSSFCRVTNIKECS